MEKWHCEQPKSLEPHSFIQKDSEIEVKEKEIEKEKIIAQEEMLELLVDKLGKGLTSPDNCNVIVQVLEKEDKAGNGKIFQDLAEEIWKYSRELKTKMIKRNNSACEFLRNLATSLLGFVERAKKKGLKADYEEMINKDFNTIREYLVLLEKYKKFEEAELNSQEGFLDGKIPEENLKKLNRIEYIRECQKFLQEEVITWL